MRDTAVENRDFDCGETLFSYSIAVCDMNILLFMFDDRSCVMCTLEFGFVGFDW